jgi:hypothetical protein
LAVAINVRSAFLDDAAPEVISRALRSVLDRRGALVTEHRHSRIRFTGLKPHALSWSRVGYVGIYQALGEREAEVRLQLRARWPWRILLTIASVNVAILLFTILLDPPGTTWSVLAILTGFALVVASVLYIATLRSVRAEEETLMDEFDVELGRLPDIEVVRDEERELQELEAELEGEIVRRKLDANRLPRGKGSRFRWGSKTAPEGSTEERRARLLARKAELEAKKLERDADGPKS